MDQAKALALEYIGRYVQDLKDPYQTALISHALNVANSNERNDAFKKLDSMKRVGQFKF